MSRGSRRAAHTAFLKSTLSNLSRGKITDELKPVPLERWLECVAQEFKEMTRRGEKPMPMEIWVSRFYIVYVYDESYQRPGMHRAMVARNAVDDTGQYLDGITWDQMWRVKAQIGRGDWYGLEVFPRQEDLIYADNVRHLWLLPEPLDIGWRLDRLPSGYRGGYGLKS